jgi:hypothetical protein
MADQRSFTAFEDNGMKGQELRSQKRMAQTMEKEAWKWAWRSASNLWKELI